MASAVPGRADPAAQVRGGGSADRAATRAAGADAAQGRPHRQARGGLRAARAHRPDAAVRPRGLVRRARGRPGLQRLGQVALPAAARRGRHPARQGARAGRRGGQIEPVQHRGHGPARRAGAAGLVRADPRAPRADRPHAAGDPAPRRRASRRHGPRAGQPGAGPLRARARRRAAVRVPQRRSAGTLPDPAARALRARPCCCSTSPPTTSTSSPPRRSRRASRPSRGRCSR